MSKTFYARLAARNMKTNARIYIPYILTCIGTIMMYYIIGSLSVNTSVEQLHGGTALVSILGFGSWIIAIFAVIFLFYTNSFLIKRRKKEFGLYNILGMEKRHLGRTMLWESFYTFLISIACGLSLGILLTELACLCFEKILHTSGIVFQVTPVIMGRAALLFGGIFLLNFLNALRQVHTANAVELLKGGNMGEREPRTRWLLAVLGVGCLVAGYYMAAAIENPIDAMAMFFVAVILVVIATYCLFTAGSIAVLKLLRKNKKFYYQRNHFISVSGMIYRMKQNAAGLASICVLSCGVLILVATTTCMYIGTEDSLTNRYPREFYMELKNAGEDAPEKTAEVRDAVLERAGVRPENELCYYVDYYMTYREGNTFYVPSPSETDKSASAYADIRCYTLEDYNRLSGRNVTLAENEVLVYEASGELADGDLEMGSLRLKKKEVLETFPISTDIIDGVVSTFFLVLPDKSASERIAEGLGGKAGWGYYSGFDLDMEVEEQIEVYYALAKEWSEKGLDGSVCSRAEARDSYYADNGGLFFIGIFLGLLFLMATVLIIYYKQISEGYDDRERYQIMQKVGMSRREVKATIRSQVLMVFYLPLIAAAFHIVFAFQMIRRILYLVGLTNVTLFMSCTGLTLLVFAALYSLVYSRTARAYYRIVS